MLIQVLCSYYLLWSNKPQHKGFLTHCTCLPFIYSSVRQMYRMFLVDHLLNLFKKAITDNLFLYIFLQAFYNALYQKNKRSKYHYAQMTFTCLRKVFRDHRPPHSFSTVSRFQCYWIWGVKLIYINSAWMRHLKQIRFDQPRELAFSTKNDSHVRTCYRMIYYMISSDLFLVFTKRKEIVWNYSLGLYFGTIKPV